MKLLKNLRIGVKLSLGFGLCLALAGAIGFTAIRGMAGMQATSQKITTDALQGARDLGALDSSLLKLRVHFYQILYLGADQKEELSAKIEADTKGVKKASDSYASSINSDEDKKNFGELTHHLDSLGQDHEQLSRLIAAGSVGKAKALLEGKTRTEFLASFDLMDKMLDWNNNEGIRLSKESLGAFQSSRTNVLTMVIAALLVGVLVALSVSKFISRHLSLISQRLTSLSTVCISNLATAVNAMESGDLTVEVVTGTNPIEVDTTEEFGQLAATLNTLVETTGRTVASFGESQRSLSHLVLELQGAAKNVADTATALAGTSQEVEASAEEIGETMREVTSATEQAARGATEVASGSATQARAISGGSDQLKALVDAVHGAAANADSASKSVEEATEVATAGGAVVAQTVQGMQGVLNSVQESASVIQELGEASEKIGSIVQTIEEIAGQTNLLALNAAIEAARAGEAGRGFAVVADEVRKLAERSGAATREIGGLISAIQSTTLDAVRSMESGMSGVKAQAELAENAGEAFDKIQKAFELVSDQVGKIGTATEKMALGADEVSRSISEVAAVIEQSSAAAEELSASSEEVSASIQTVASSTHQQVAAVRDLVQNSETLSELARTLQASVSQFKARPSSSGEPEKRRNHLKAA